MTIQHTPFEIDTTVYMREAMANLFFEYRLMSITMMLAIGIALLIASSCAKREPLTTTQFLRLFWVELCSIVLICAYSIYTLFHMAQQITVM